MSDIKKMSAPPQNLSAFTYWQAPEHPPPENGLQPYPNSGFLPEASKSKFFRHPMFFLNNIKQDLTPEYDKNFTQEMQHRHFLAPLSTPDFHPENSNSGPPKPIERPPEEDRKRSIINNTIIPSKESSGKVRPYVCDDCGKSFLLKHHLTTHARTHTGIRPHVCTHCGKSFTHKHCLNTHLLLHSSERPYQCEECKKSFTLKHHLLTHARVHSREKPFVCTECGQAFPLKRHLITHSKFHAGERPFICEECGESFAQKDHLVMHSRFHGFVNSFVCSDCGATFSRKFELVNHNKLHGKEPYSCPLCNKEFLQKRTLAAHIRLHSAQSPFVCPQCGESFPSSQELASHIKSHSNNTHNGSPHKALVCQECTCVFNSVEALALHIKLHTGDASLVTDLCTLTSSLQQSNFTINNHSHNNSIPPVKQKLHVCQHCSKAFTAKHGLHQHNKKHPDGVCALRTHVCGICSKAFFQKNHLLLHQRQHMDPSEKNSSHNAHNQNANKAIPHGSNLNAPNNEEVPKNIVSTQAVESHSDGGVVNMSNRYEETKSDLSDNNYNHQYHYGQPHCGSMSHEQPRNNGEYQEARNVKNDHHNMMAEESLDNNKKIHAGVICSQAPIGEKNQDNLNNLKPNMS